MIGFGIMRREAEAYLAEVAGRCFGDSGGGGGGDEREERSLSCRVG